VPGREGDLRLVAHVRRTEGAWPSARDLRLGLKDALPSFMIPAAFFVIDDLPVSERGKIDREALRQSALGAVVPEAEYVAPRTELEQDLAEIVADVLHLDRVGVDDDLFGLGADSFTAAELIAGIGERLGIELSAGDLYEAPTVGSLAARFGDSARAVERLVFPLYTGGSGAPFFLVSGIAHAGMLALRRLARRLDRPTYSFTPHGYTKRGIPDRTIETTATRFLGALRRVQPAGPYLIGGYSFGALVGYEMAQQLHAAGEEVALLVLLDPASASSGLRGNVERVSARARRRSPRQAAVARQMAKHAALWVGHGIETKTAGILVRPPRRQFRIFVLLSLRMGRRYRPRPYGGTALVLRTGGWRALDRLDLGGSFLTGEKRLVLIPGNHITAIHEPHAEALGALLREALAAADPSTSAATARAAP
jgi:thioesterase domain-containing protein/acyl carrier protein